jgi:hypothetical protein
MKNILRSVLVKNAADRYVEMPDSLPEKTGYNRNLFNPSKVDTLQFAGAAAQSLLGNNEPLHELANSLPYTPFRSSRTDERLGKNNDLEDVTRYYLSNPLDAVKDYGKALGRGHTGTLIGTGVGLGAAGLLAYYLMKKKKKS